MVTGKMRGFTLLEVLGVILLIGMVLALALPRFQNSEEKTALKMIAGTIKSDLNLVREEAIMNQDDIVVSFANNGYSFNLANSSFERSFARHRFFFDIPKSEPDAIAEDDVNTDETSGITGSETDETGSEPASNELTYNGDGSCSGITLNWKTDHYCGTLTVDQTGEVIWTREFQK